MLEKTSDHADQEHERVSTSSANRRLEKLKGKIWALTLEEAEKYFEMAEFAEAGNQHEEQEIEKIKAHLQRRIEKLTRREHFEKTETQQRMRLQLLEREMERARASAIMTQSKMSNSLITLKELEGAIGGHKDFPVGDANEEPINEELSVSIMEGSQKGVQTEELVRTYAQLYQNIAELRSTDNTEEYDDGLDDSDSQPQPTEQNTVRQQLSVKKRVYERCFKNLRWLADKLSDIKHFVLNG